MKLIWWEFKDLSVQRGRRSHNKLGPKLWVGSHPMHDEECCYLHVNNQAVGSSGNPRPWRVGFVKSTYSGRRQGGSGSKADSGLATLTYLKKESVMKGRSWRAEETGFIDPS